MLYFNILIVALVERLCGFHWFNCSEGSTGMAHGYLMGVAVEGFHKLVDFIGQLSNIDESSQLAAIDDDGFDVVHL